MVKPHRNTRCFSGCPYSAAAVQTEHAKLSDVALDILRERILLQDESGKPRETPEEMFSRVAWAVASVEHRWAASADVREVADAFRRLMQSLDFLPNSPTLVNAGIPDGQLSGCFVLPIEDSMESIFGTLRDVLMPLGLAIPPIRAQMVRSMLGIKRGIVRRSLPLEPLRKALAAG